MADEIATALLPVFFVLALGYGAGKRRIVDNTNVGTLNTLVMSIALPIALFTSLAAGRREAVLARWPFAVIFLIVMALVYTLTYVVQRRVHGMTPSEAALQALTVAFPNIAAVGLPLVGAVLGPDAMLSVA
ncbi:MAG TPA: AEC family transporter, partial [Actinoplanes sp.]|nr:AEC family transporter [Actinoplanes sp.]